MGRSVARLVHLPKLPLSMIELVAFSCRFREEEQEMHIGMPRRCYKNAGMGNISMPQKNPITKSVICTFIWLLSRAFSLHFPFISKNSTRSSRY